MYKFKVGDKVKLKKSYVENWGDILNRQALEEAEIIHISNGSVTLNFSGPIVPWAMTSTWHTCLEVLEPVAFVQTLWDI